tara:strand:- start:1157 stop:1711 length:555 start_codon:yes stop_codon:yes gene_type:complete
MHYDPECEYSRQHLAISITSRLDDAGFEKVDVIEYSKSAYRSIQTKEHIYERDIDDTGLKVQVYTTIVDDNNLGMTVRTTGKDAIRVNVRSPDIKRALITETRVNRTGEISDIVERMIQRARDVYKLGRQSGKCHKCGAPRAMSKAGKWYCAKVCWKSEEEKARDSSEWRLKNRKSRFSRRYRR